MCLFKFWLVWENEEVVDLQACEYGIHHYSSFLDFGNRLTLVIPKAIWRKMVKEIGSYNIKLDLNINTLWFEKKMMEYDWSQVIWVSKLGIVHEQQAYHEVLYEVNLSQKSKDNFILWASLLPSLASEGQVKCRK